MIGNIRIERVLSSEIKMNWEFTLLESQKLDLLCTYFSLQKKNNKKWEVVSRYNTYDKRNTNLKIDQFEIPQNVLDEAKQKLIDKIYVGKWNKS